MDGAGLSKAATPPPKFQRVETTRSTFPVPLIDRSDCAQKFGEVFAVSRRLIERCQPRIRERLRQYHPPRLRIFSENNFVPLNRRDLVVVPRNRATPEKCPGRFRRIED